MGKRAVRVYFDSKLMADARFSKRHESFKGRTETTYQFDGLPINFYDGHFSMDAIDGEVPEIFKEFISRKYCLKEIWLDGYRHGGLYRDERYSEAEAEVKQCNPARPGDRSSSYNVEIYGTNLEHILGLYQAILADELVPVSFGKSAAQLIEDLRDQLAKCNHQLELETDLCKTAEAFDIEQLELIKTQKSELEQNLLLIASLEREMSAREEAIRELENKLAQATRPWYRKLTRWFSEKNDALTSFVNS